MAVVFTAALLRLHSGFLECGLDKEKLGDFPRTWKGRKCITAWFLNKYHCNRYRLREMVLFSVDGSILSDLPVLSNFSDEKIELLHIYLKSFSN